MMEAAKEVLVTGANGFIGRALVSKLLLEGIAVTSLTRRWLAAPDGNTSPNSWSLGKNLPAEAIKAYDCVIHLAHDFSNEVTASISVKGTLDIIDQLESAGAKKQIFISSLSAGDHAKSIYGRSKREIEKSLEGRNVIIVRPGLVLGDGGIYARIRHFVNATRIAPLPDGGGGKVAFITVDYLCQLLFELIKDSKKIKELNFFEPQMRSLRDLLLKDPILKDKSFVVLPIPSAFFLSILTFSELLGIRLPIRSDNLRGFLANQNSQHRSSLEEKDDY